MYVMIMRDLEGKSVSLKALQGPVTEAELLERLKKNSICSNERLLIIRLESNAYHKLLFLLLEYMKTIHCKCFAVKIT